MGKYANKERRHKWYQRGLWVWAFCSPNVRQAAIHARANEANKGLKECRQCARIPAFRGVVEMDSVPDRETRAASITGSLSPGQ